MTPDSSLPPRRLTLATASSSFGTLTDIDQKGGMFMPFGLSIRPATATPPLRLNWV